MYPDTFSQFDEETAILGNIRKQRGRFLDIGAWSPECFSNTRALYLAGWSGVMIEPSPEPMLALIKAYGYDDRVELVQAAMVADDRRSTLMEITADGLSTDSRENFDKWREKGGYYGRMRAMAITWADINLMWGGFDFVSIDTEGSSVDVFRSMLASGAKPPCVCVEHDNRLPELGAMATEAGYKMLYCNGTNAVFGL